jgi:hypothetical protein
LSSAQVLFETNGVPNPNQGVLNIVGAGDISVTINALGQTVVESTGFVLPGTGTGNLVVTANAGVGTAPVGDILQADGLGNAADSGTLLSSLAPKANATFSGTTTIPTAIIATANITSINGLLNATDYPGADIGAKVNAAIAALPANGGTVYIPAGSYTQSTTILLPRYVLLQGASAFGTQLTYTGAGWAVIIADASGGGNYPEGGIADLTLAGPGNTTATGGVYLGGSDGVVAGSGTVNVSGTGVTSESGTGFSTATWQAGTVIIINGVAYPISSVNSSSSITLVTSGGTQTGSTYFVVASPSTASDPGTNYGDQVNINRVRIGGNATGFGVGLQYGANSWSTAFSQGLIDGNVVGIIFPGGAFSIGSGERLCFVDSAIQNNVSTGVVCSDGGEMYFTNCSFDYNQAATYTNFTGLSVEQTDGATLTFSGCHFEKYSGDHFLINSTQYGNTYIYGGVMVNTIGTTTSTEMINVTSANAGNVYIYGLGTNYAVGQTVDYLVNWNASTSGNLLMSGVSIGTAFATATVGGAPGTQSLLGNGSLTLRQVPTNGIVFTPAANGVGTGMILGTNAANSLVLWDIDQVGNATFPTLTVGQATPTGSLSGIAFGDTTGFGNGASGNVTVLAKGSGSGPATPGTIVGFMEINVQGTVAWVPYCR